MRAIGAAERALELMCQRTLARVTFGKPVAERTVTQERIAESRTMLEAARLLTLKAAYMMDTVGNKQARAEIAMIKVYVPNVAQQIMDWSIQAHGGGGVSDDFPVAGCLPGIASCASSTARTKSTGTRSPSSSWRSTSRCRRRASGVCESGGAGETGSDAPLPSPTPAAARARRRGRQPAARRRAVQ